MLLSYLGRFFLLNFISIRKYIDTYALFSISQNYVKLCKILLPEYKTDIQESFRVSHKECVEVLAKKM